MRVLHDSARRRFAVHLPQGDGELNYSIPRAGVMNLYHAGVAESIRGQGVASALVTEALRYAREHEQQVIPSCPYVAHWVTQHPEEQDLLVPM